LNLQTVAEFIRVALTALRLNKLRSVLTALGIIIGVASVIVMEAIGNGAAIALQQQIAALGTNVLNVMTGSMRIGGRQLGFGGAVPLSEQDMRVIRERVPGIAAISGQLTGSGQLEHAAERRARRVLRRAPLAARDRPLFHRGGSRQWRARRAAWRVGA
jgi:putative ABC transport system permease protein